MLFCPTCSNILLCEKTMHDFRFFCRTCPYIFKVEQHFETKMDLERKQVDDVLGGKGAWANVDKQKIKCENGDAKVKCINDWAYYMAIQIRSGDEPATIFYKCTEC